jgi:endonuclease YncB( thermonuclease family)
MYTPRMSTHLETVVYNETRPFVPDVRFGKVVKVYDADTITVANRISLDGGNTYSTEIYRFNVRLNGIDTPEIKSTNPATKARAVNARDALRYLILDKVVQLSNVSTDKYGRLLADVYFETLHINQWLLDQKYATPYAGGTKVIPEEWES